MVSTVAIQKIDFNISNYMGRFDACLKSELVAGELGKFHYALINQQQVILGHQNFVHAEFGDQLTCAQSVFISLGEQKKRKIETWETLREFLAKGWMIGTKKHPGVKVWIALKGWNSYANPADLFVFR